MRRFELPTPWSVAKCSIQLSYIHMFNCRRPESNRYGRLVPQDFKSCASASSATPALNGTNRARTCDPLLVRQVLSQLSYDPKVSLFISDLINITYLNSNVNNFFKLFLLYFLFFISFQAKGFPI